jgi:hypothetical protein
VQGDLNTGIFYDWGNLEREAGDSGYGIYPEYQIQDTNLPPYAVSPPLLGDATATNFFCRPNPGDPAGNPQLYADTGLGVNGNGYLSLPTGVRNIYGLPILSVKDISGDEIDAGAGAMFTWDQFEGNWYMETALPSLATVGYYFASQTPHDSYGFPLTPAPGTPGFTPTNTPPLLIAGMNGWSFSVMGWAKQTIQNGYSGKFAYLEQHFDRAYTEDTNGVATTNSAGVLSAYGQFFPTMPGPAALVTMPDIDPPYQRGTCTVYCVSLVSDKNHDWKMDGSFNGPDTTSQASPMEFFINNDYDYTGASWDLGHDVQSGWYYNDGYQQKIDSQRDLEDYARLWICGMPALTNGNYQVTLSWANVSSGSPTINLFDTVETNGGIGYLTNLDTATAEAFNYGIWGEYRRAIAQISPSQPFTFPASYFTNAGDKHFLFDGAITNGAGELVLTISQNGNQIAQTGLWLDLHDVRDFYERAVITNNMSGAKSNWTSSVEIVQQATASALGDDTNLIVLVHGINVRPWDCLQQGDTVFKRLYWAGFRGKFVSVEWPCNLLTPIPNPLSPAVFNDSELQGYKASTALTNYLGQLRARFPGYRLNILAHSQGNTVVSEAIKRGFTSFDTYILTQGALPDSAYDVNAPIDYDIAAYEDSRITPEWQPMGYHGIYTNFTGNIVNFYNPLDPVLDWWVRDQKLLKPSLYFDTSYYFYNGTNSYFDPPFSANYLVTDPEESRANVSRSRTLPVGQSGPESAHGVIQSAFDLHARFNFSNTSFDDHSAQWAWPIQTTLPYYIQILRSINP